VSYSQIAQIERGESGGSEHSAKAIADALGLTVDDIWRYDT
jgi:transcriptional regulator with XRE-family HTH domain